MIFEFDWNQGLFVARSRGPKKRFGGGRQSPELDIRHIAKIFIQWNKNWYLLRVVYRIFLQSFQKVYFSHLWSIFTDIRSQGVAIYCTVVLGPAGFPFWYKKEENKVTIQTKLSECLLICLPSQVRSEVFPTLAKAGKKQWFLTIKTLLCTNCTCMMTYAFRSDFFSVAAVRLRHNRAIYTRKNKTRLT